MARRAVLTRPAAGGLIDLPGEEASLLRHSVLNENDLAHVRRRRHDRNQLGFALQLCAFRYPGQLIGKGETIPAAMLTFVAAQLGMREDAVLDTAALQRIYGYRPFEGLGPDQFAEWLEGAAIEARVVVAPIVRTATGLQIGAAPWLHVRN